MTKSQMCRGGVLNKYQSILRSKVIQYRQLFLETMYVWKLCLILQAKREVAFCSSTETISYGRFELLSCTLKCYFIDPQHL